MDDRPSGLPAIELPGGAAQRRSGGTRAPLTIGFVGNCQAELLHQAFASIAPATEFASFYHFFDIADAALPAAGAALAACDVLLLQDIRDVDAYPLREAVPPGTAIHYFPFLRFASPWPYDDFNGLRDTAARERDDPATHTTTYYDGILGRLRRLVPEPRARLDAYLAGNLPVMVDPVRLHDFESRRLEALDERFGLDIGRFILERFRETQLFYTVNRPCGLLLERLLAHILETLDLDLRPPSPDTLDDLSSIEVPVHPLVAERLSIAWAHRARRYRNGGQWLSFEEHARAYIERYG